ncbi:MAG TPA: TonB-dependent receptor, partial [Bryobacteraceae bacterium]|nr:TonB-dependent receptor [Bryobacteraceae bacterium]
NIGTTDIAQAFDDTVIQAEDTAIIVKGQHTMHAGFQFFRYRNDVYYSGQGGAAGEFYFNGQYTSLANTSAIGNGGADFVLGLPEFISLGQNVGTRGLRYSSIGAFFQDDWKVSRKLTLNLGLRYQLHTPQYEVDNRATNYGLTSGQVYLAGNGSCPFSNCRALYNQYNGITNYQPRLGLAWTPFGSKTVFRAAWGVTDFFEGIGVANIPAANPPWQGAGQASYLSTDPLPGSTLSQGFATLPPPVCTPATAVATPSSASCFQSQTIHVLNPDFRPTVSQQWNVTVEHQFGNSTTVSAAYVGERNTHLTNIYYGQQRVLNPDGTVSNSLYLTGNPALHQETGGVVGFNSGIERIIDSNGYGNYHALQLSLQHRLSTGLQFQLNYTFSKCLTNAPGFFGQYGDANSSQTQANGGYAFPEYTYNQALDYGPCPNDVSQEFNGYATYDVPFGRGRAFGKNVSKPMDAVLGGWQVNLLLNVHTGFPFEVTATDNSGTRSGNPRADCIAPPHVFGDQDSPLGGYQFWDPSSFTQPPVGQLGNCGTGIIRGPGMTEADLGLSKIFKITESKSLEVRGEAINVANAVILNAPTGRIGASFGLVQSAQLPRNVQLALKFHF